MTDHQHYQPVTATIDTTIASSGTTSEIIDLRGTTLCGIHMPAAFDGTGLSFEIAPSIGGTYQTMYKNGADRSEIVAPGKYVELDPVAFAGVQFMKITSDTTETAARTLTLAVRPV